MRQNHDTWYSAMLLFGIINTKDGGVLKRAHDKTCPIEL